MFLMLMNSIEINPYGLLVSFSLPHLPISVNGKYCAVASIKHERWFHIWIPKAFVIMVMMMAGVFVHALISRTGCTLSLLAYSICIECFYLNENEN